MRALRRLIARHIAYPLALTVNSVRRGAGLRPMALFRRLERMARAEPPVWQAFRNRQLRVALENALRHIPFYRDVASDLLPLVEDDPMAALRQFPVLTKRDFQEHEKELLADYEPRGGRYRYNTSGSTGEPTRFWLDRRRARVRLLGAYRDKGYLGWRPGDPGALIEVPGGFFWKHSRLRRWLTRLAPTYVGLNVHEMNPETNRHFLEQLERLRPVLIRGIASGLDEYARFLESEGLDARARALGLRGIITMSEQLLPWYRESIERVFGTRVFDMFGSNEVGVVALECSAHRGLHVAADMVVVEILDDAGRPLPPGESGRIVVTDPWNMGFSLIRVDLGDVAHYLPDEDACPCGVTFPRLGAIEGRRVDFIALPDGRRIHGFHFMGYLNSIEGLREYRIVQETTDELVIRLVGDREAIEPQLGPLHKGTPPGLRLRFEYCEELPRTARGKRLLVISHVQQPPNATA